MFSTFDLRLLLYVIRLAGWLKHCNLSLLAGENAAITLSLLTCVSSPKTLRIRDK